MGVTAAWAAVAVSAGSAYASNQKANKAEAQQERANNAAAQNAKATLDASNEANNKANQKRPNGSALLSSNQEASKAGQAGTLLTGPMGIDPSLLQLGKSTLLGGS